jgi:integrase
LSEGLQLRVKDVDFAQHQLVIRDTKGKESRVTMLPTRLLEPLQIHLQTVQQLHHQDFSRGYATALLESLVPIKVTTRNWNTIKRLLRKYA